MAQSFTVGTPPVLTLWEPQQDLLQRAVGNPLDPATNRLLLSVPTSAGKTLLAQIVICTHLATRPGDVCYVTPLRSLGRELRQALNRRLRVLDRNLGPELPDFPGGHVGGLLSEIAAGQRGDVEVMTPERLMHLLRRDPEAVLSRFGLFVVDEAHLLAEQSRGFLLESLLSLLTASRARLMLLSGVLGNAASLTTWLAPGQSEVLYTSDWRGPRRMHALLYATPLWDLKQERPRRSKARPTRITVPLVAKLRLRPAESQVVDLVTNTDDPLGVLALDVEAATGRQVRAQDGNTPTYKIVARAATGLLHAGSLLMIVSTREIARRAAQALAEELPDTPGTRELAAFLTERLGGEHPLVGCVRRGVGYHHAGLPVDVLEALEQGLRGDQLAAMVATTTLTEGVNLPVRTVVISETSWEGQQIDGRLDAAKLLNALGRAGRAGRETEGWIVLVMHKQEAYTDFDRLQPADAALEVRSTLLSDQALNSLAEAEQLIAQTTDAVLRLEPGPASDFAAYVWLVLSAVERLAALPSATNPGAVIGQLLALQQMDPTLRDRWVALANQVGRVYAATPAARRHRWAQTGTSLATAASLDRLATEVAQAVLRQYQGQENPFEDPIVMSASETMDVLARVNAFDALLRLPEGQREWRFRATGRGQKITVPVLPALRAWLDGVEMPSLAQATLPTVTDAAWRLEQMVDAVSGTFEHYLSWTTGVLIEQANSQLEDADAPMLLRQDVAWMIRYGVDTPEALALLTDGIQSRRLAHTLGRTAAAQQLATDDLRQMLTDLHIAGWRSQFGATPREVLELLEFTRARRRSLLRNLLETGTGTVDIRLHTASPLDHEPLPVTVSSAGPPPAELILLHGDTQIGVVSAPSHVDVADVLASGLDVTIEVQDTQAVFTVTD